MKFITDSPNISACIRKVIKVVVKKFMMNRFVIMATEYSALVVYCWNSANAYTTFVINSQIIMIIKDIDRLITTDWVYSFQYF